MVLPSAFKSTLLPVGALLWASTAPKAVASGSRYVAGQVATASDTEVTLFLIGDAGAPRPEGDPVLAALAAEAAASSASARVVVFLGDNAYPHGLPDSSSPDRRESERRLDAQVAVARASGARVIFIPGNHDWDAARGDGWVAIRREGAYLDAAGRLLPMVDGAPAVAMLPAGGCPGPAVVDIGARLRLVLLDTQWWLQHGPRPAAMTTPCVDATPQAFRDSLQRDVRNADARMVIVAAHHPVVSGGVHGEPVRWRDPSTIPAALARRLVRSDQDFSGARYRALRAELDSIFATDPPFIYAAGHDHGLQVIQGHQPPEYVVSGAGTYHHLDRVEPTDSTRYEAHESGYMRLDLLRVRGVRLTVRVVDASGHAHDAYTQEWP
jgi:Calcineurin-like phosphoesterase